MNKRLLATVMISCSLFAAGVVVGSNDRAVELRSLLRKSDPALNVGEIEASPVTGLYGTSLDGAPGYITADGKYFIVGDMFEVLSKRNITEQKREAVRKASVARVSVADMIVFAPAKPKHTVTVFTDVECAYCRKFHSEIEKYNELGIAVRYVAMPREGKGSRAWSTMESVWCSADRRAALTRAKRDQPVSRRADCKAPQIETQWTIAHELGFQGTPSIVLEDGRLVAGYLPPKELADELAKQPPASKPAG